MKRGELLLVYDDQGIIVTEFHDTERLVDAMAAAAMALVGESKLSAQVRLAAAELAARISEERGRPAPPQSKAGGVTR